MSVRKALKMVLRALSTSIIEMMEEVGVTGPDGSRDEFNLGHIAFHMPGRMSSKSLAVFVQEIWTTEPTGEVDLTY